jgi:hypothetical protein
MLSRRNFVFVVLYPRRPIALGLGLSFPPSAPSACGCNAVDRVGHLMDVYGRGRREVGYKLDGLRDYMFHLVVENGRVDHFFSEKLIDCLVTGTVPIYWGCPSIGDFFDVGGMVRFDSVDELPNIVKSLTPELYRSILHHVAENFERAKGFLTSEIYMIKNGII